LLPQAQHAVDVRVDHRSAGIGLKGNVVHVEGLAQVMGQVVIVRNSGRCKGAKEVVLAFEQRPRSEEAFTGNERGPVAGLRRPAGMKPLRPGAVRQEFNDPRGETPRNADRHGEFLRLEPQCRADADGRAERADHTHRVEARLVHLACGNVVQPADGFQARDDAEKHLLAGKMVPLTGREHRRKHHGSHSDRGALERVVEILAMRRDAVDDRGTCSIEAAHMADQRAGSVAVPTTHDLLDVSLSPGGNAQPGHVDQVA
jgi:hypothetical protein